MGVRTTDLLGRGLQRLRARLPAVYATSLIVSLPLLVLQLGVPTLMRGRLSPLPGGALVGALLVAILTYTLQVLGTAAVLPLVSGEDDGRPVAWKGALRLLSHRFGSLLTSGFLYALAVVAGLLLGGVPGVLFLAWHVFVPQVVVMEGLGGGRALRRSRELTRDCRAQVLGLVLLFLSMAFVLYGLMSGLATVLPAVESVPAGQPAVVSGPAYVLNYPNYAVVTALTYLLIGFIQSYQAVCFTLLYFRLRDRGGSPGLDTGLGGRQESGMNSPREC